MRRVPPPTSRLPAEPRPESGLGKRNPPGAITFNSGLRHANPPYNSARTVAAIFSPIMMVGMLVLAHGTDGMIEASATRRPVTP